MADSGQPLRRWPDIREWRGNGASCARPITATFRQGCSDVRDRWYLPAGRRRARAVRAMGRCLAHRGPDDDGLYSHTDDRVSVNLAHRRLSIIDLSGGHQPLVKGPLALCYNGELYNYREIRAELRARGSTFTTSSDTEVVLEAWRQFGPDCLRRFRGMFAFALFDRDSGSLYLARDQLGIKPLHYLVREDGVVFSSELKALVAAYGSQLRMDPGVSGRLGAVLVGARPAVLDPRRREAAARHLGGVPPRWHLPDRLLLGRRPGGGRRGGGPAIDLGQR